MADISLKYFITVSKLITKTLSVIIYKILYHGKRSFTTYFFFFLVFAVCALSFAVCAFL